MRPAFSHPDFPGSSGFDHPEKSDIITLCVSISALVNHAGKTVNLHDGSASTELNEFFRTCRGSDDPFDEQVDHLLATVPGTRLASGLSTVLSAGEPEDWPRALHLVSLLGNEHGDLWNVLIEAVERRRDLVWHDIMQAVALLKTQNRLPETGRVAELAEEWAEEFAASQGDLETLIQLLEDDPEGAPEWLGGIATWSRAEREHLLAQLQERPAGRGRDTLIEWLDAYERADLTVADPVSCERPEVVTTDPEPDRPAWELRKLEVSSLWATDLLLDGTFGAGLEKAEEPRRRYVVAGSLAEGVLFTESFEPTGQDAFVPRLPPGRQVSFHPVFVHQGLSRLIDAGIATSMSTDRSRAILEVLSQELATSRTSDSAAWENWTKRLVDTNPLDRRASALAADAELTLQELDHWLFVDALASELASEFRTSIDQVPADRLRSAMRVWFERSLGPQMGRILENLQLMGYFWLSLADLDTAGQEHRWYAAARASGRIVADLSDPSRVVATHPFVELWMKRIFEKALGER